MKTLLILAFFTLSSFAVTTPWQDKFNLYVKGLPKEVISILERVDGCIHFGSEEPYDEQRKNEILRAVKKLKCDSIDKDRSVILKKYKNQNSIINKINKFPEALN